VNHPIYNLDISNAPDAGGHFGRFGGRFAAETLMQPLKEIEEAFFAAWADPAFHAERLDLLKHYVGRATPLYHARRLSAANGGAHAASGFGGGVTVGAVVSLNLASFKCTGNGPSIVYISC